MHNNMSEQARQLAARRIISDLVLKVYGNDDLDFIEEQTNK